ncbi:MAG: type II toxin-antitoxin system ParD family antitoxin [Acidobacteria bacterium]|nr:type II toxin-antitoxin system ParD family antitoxin [Acidobacteriota bacterium]
MTNINISLPESMRAYVEQKIESGGYGTISEYLRELIRADERREMEYFDKLIADAYANGPVVPLTKEDIELARQETLRRIQTRKGRK